MVLSVGLIKLKNCKCRSYHWSPRLFILNIFNFKFHGALSVCVLIDAEINSTVFAYLALPLFERKRARPQNQAWSSHIQW